MRSYIKGMLTACLFYPLFLNAQNEIDALRYSQGNPSSTARSLSMGGAFGALGADFSSMSINPAGLGVYRKSEFTFSLGFNNSNIESEFLGNKSSDSKFSMDIPDLGLVFAFPKTRGGEWKQFGFGLGYNRTANFNADYSFEGKNNNNSLLNAITESINSNGGATPDDLFNFYPFDGDLAYQTYLINPIPGDTNFYNSVIPNGGAYQSLSVTTRGGMGEFSLGFGANYNEKLYFGLSLAFPNIRYEEESSYKETDKDNQIIEPDSSSDFKSFGYDQFLTTTANGFNAKFGIIAKPLEWIRLGLAVHTPTIFFMNDKYKTEMHSSFSNGSFSWNSPESSYSYELVTPFKAVGSIALLYRQQGLISVDYEFVNYSSAKLDASDYDFRTENNIIKKIYNDVASNVRAGVEWKYDKFSFRAGASYYSTPFAKGISSSKTDQHAMTYSGGIGYREKKYFFDLGYSYSKRNEFFSMYTLSGEDVPGAILERVNHRIIATLGIRF